MRWTTEAAHGHEVQPLTIFLMNWSLAHNFSCQRSSASSLAPEPERSGPAPVLEFVLFMASSCHCSGWMNLLFDNNNKNEYFKLSVLFSRDSDLRTSIVCPWVGGCMHDQNLKSTLLSNKESSRVINCHQESSRDLVSFSLYSDIYPLRIVQLWIKLENF